MFVTKRRPNFSFPVELTSGVSIELKVERKGKEQGAVGLAVVVRNWKSEAIQTAGASQKR